MWLQELPRVPLSGLSTRRKSLSKSQEAARWEMGRAFSFYSAHAQSRTASDYAQWHLVAGCGLELLDELDRRAR